MNLNTERNLRGFSFLFVALALLSTNPIFGAEGTASDSRQTREPVPKLLPPSQSANLDIIEDGETKDVTRFGQCKRITNEGFFELFMPNRSVEEWTAFIETAKDPTKSETARVKVADCTAGSGAGGGCISASNPLRPPPGPTYVFEGACQHIKNDSYDNGSSNARYRMACARTANIGDLIDGKLFAIPPGQRVANLKVSFQAGCCAEYRNRNEDRIYTYPTNNAQISGSVYQGEFSINPSTSLYRALCTSNGIQPANLIPSNPCSKSKWRAWEFEYDPTTRTATVRNVSNGWGDCRATGCSSCVGNIVVGYTLEPI